MNISGFQHSTVADNVIYLSLHGLEQQVSTQCGINLQHTMVGAPRT